MNASHSASPPFFCVRVAAADSARAEWAVAEAFAAGAAGVEELVEEGRVIFAVYAPEAARDPVRDAVEATGAQVLDVSPVPAQDWSEAWKRDLAPIVVSPRLVLRPSFARVEARTGQRVLELDPGQAFGTGAHESTRLALEGIDRLADALDASGVLLDVGTGTGVLALAGLALGCGRAVALDLDPLAGQAARENAQRNGLSAGLDVFVGGIDALHPGARFDVVAANLLVSELLPVLPAIAAHLRPGGRLVLAGLLDGQLAEVLARARSLGLASLDTLRRSDASGAIWAALVMRREPAAARR
jgi:ribosomal protein L11 methyltransferase